MRQSLIEAAGVGYAVQGSGWSVRLTLDDALAQGRARTHLVLVTGELVEVAVRDEEGRPVDWRVSSQSSDPGSGVDRW